MMAYSMSKTITAVAVLQLIETCLTNRSNAISVSATVRAGCDDPAAALAHLRHTESHSVAMGECGGPTATFDEDGALAAVLTKHPRLPVRAGQPPHLPRPL